MFLKSLLGSGAVTLFNALRAFAINKLLAIFLPPATFACVGQFLNLMTIGQATSSLAMQNGWTSLTSQNKNDKNLLGIWRGGIRLTTFASLFTFIAAVIFCFVAPLQILFPTMHPRFVQAAILFALPGIFATNIITICAAVMNGLGENKKWALINIVTSVWQIIWVAFFLYTGKLSVLSIIATQSIIAGIFAAQIAKQAGFSVTKIWKSVQDIRSPWFSFAAMGIVPMILTPISLTIIRSNVALNFGMNAAGIWQGIFKISDFLFMGFSAVLTVILLPKISKKMNPLEFNKMFYPLFFKIMATAAVVIFAFYFGRTILVQVLLSESYIGAVDYLPYQLAGDFFRCLGFMFALVLIAKQETKKFLIVEVFSQVFLTVATFIFIKIFEFKGPMFAYTLENFLYFIILLFVVRALKWKSL